MLLAILCKLGHLDAKFLGRCSVNTFTLDEAEEKSANAFVKLHYEKCRKYVKVSLTAIATGVGSKFVVKCLHCSVEEDISNYDSW